VFGSVSNAIGKYFTRQDGTRIQGFGIVEDGKYNNLTEAQQPAMFLPMLQSASSQTFLVVRSDRDPGQLIAAIRSTVRGLDAGLPLYIEPWNNKCTTFYFLRTWPQWRWGVLGIMGAMLSITASSHGGVLRQQAP